MVLNDFSPMASAPRWIAIDVEATGANPEDGHRIIELAAVEFVDSTPTGRTLHSHFDPERPVDADAEAVHGLGYEFLQEKPLFQTFAPALIDFAHGAVLVVHQAPFALGFIEAELERAGKPRLRSVVAQVIDTLQLARRMRNGETNHLDALCFEFSIPVGDDPSLHGSLLDATLIGKIYMRLVQRLHH